MKERLLSTSSRHHLTPRNYYRSLCIALLIFCGAAALGQPMMVSQITPGSKNLTNVNGRLYYSVSGSLYTASKTSPEALVANTGENILAIYNLTIGSSFFFVTQSGTQQSLWRSDGTAGNTQKITTQLQINPLVIYNSQLYARINSSAYGVELWKVDGSFTASLVKDINPGPAHGLGWAAVVYNNQLYFFATNGTGTDIWRSNGTTAGTVMSVDLKDGETLSPSKHSLTIVGNIMLFAWEYTFGEYDERFAELWRTDGTQSGTSRVAQYPGANTYNYLSDLIEVDGKLFFFHSEGEPQYHYISVSDGTPGGTRHIDRTSIDGSPEKIVDGGEYAVYYASSQGNATGIEKTEGTSATLVHDFSYYHGTQEETIRLTGTGGRAFFLDDTGDYYGEEDEIWQADLASGETRTLEEMYGFSLNKSGNIVADNGSIYFTRMLGSEMTLWYYNPETSGGTSCSGVGSIEREKWANVAGTSVTQIPTTTKDPTSITALSSFASVRNEGDNYGARVRGYVCVPESGNYVFYISSDDNSELWLSTDDSPANKKLIASSKWTAYNQWDKYPTQTSAGIPLEKGRKYYIEALHKEGTGGDHLTVGWKLPNGTLERPIPGSRLIPFNRGTAPNVYLYDPWDGQAFTAPANIYMQASATDDDGFITKVEFIVKDKFYAADASAPYSTNWNNVPAGTYTVEARATDNEGNIRSDFSNITVKAQSCSGTGGMFQEFWGNVTGTDVRSFDFSGYYTAGYRYLNAFETDQYYGNNYASRMRGYVCVPQTGPYTFWISSDDYSELYLSTDDTEANKKLVAWVYGVTRFREYDKYASQKSVQITLQAGQRYYIEARHKEGTGNDFISVGWTLPDGTLERPIGGNRLISISPAANNPPSVAITSPQENQQFTAPANIRITADVEDPDGLKYVKFSYVQGSSMYQLATFTAPPYEYEWRNVPASTYQVVVEAQDNQGSTSIQSVSITVTGGPECSGTGTIMREIWTGIPGTSVSSIPVDESPDRIVQLTSLATQNYYGNDYGSRIRGYVCAPQTGRYTFWISGDDNSELWLSSSEDPAGKQRIAYVSGSTAVNQWSKYPSQVSTQIDLVQGQRYYIEVLHKEGNGADHVEVGWHLPSGPLERPIPGNRIIPFEDASTSAATFTTEGLFDEEEVSDIAIYPNPVVSGNEISISLPGSAEEAEVAVDIVSMTGVSVQNERLTPSAEAVTLGIKSSIVPGMYVIKVAGSKKRWAKKLQVK
ncbi:MAG TPA: PA14 domain-containing protein [Chryseosolibacter sp.]